MWVGEIDVHDDDLLRAYWAAGKEGDEFDRPYAAYRSIEALTVGLRNKTIFSDIVALAATEDDEVLGIGEVVAPKLDNTHLAMLQVTVPPAHRGRGVGTAILDAALNISRDLGRRTAISEVNMPFEPPPHSPGSKFLERHGFTSASLEIHRVLELPGDPAHLDALEQKAAAHHTDYRLESFTDRVPDDRIEGFCALQSAFNSEAPIGDLDLEPEVWDETRVREGEARSAQMGRHLQGTLAVDRTGEVVALTEMVTNEHMPEVGWQSGTLVVREHRGHRLGLAVKIANQRRFQEAFPTVTLIHSWNGEENGPMVAINDTLGFRPVEYLAEMQRKI